MADKQAKKAISRRRLLKLGLFGTAVIGCAAYEWNEKDRLTIESQTLRIPRWSADGFKLAFLSDLHTNEKVDLDRGIKALEMAAAERPDLILLGGDYINMQHTRAMACAKKLFEKCASLEIPAMAILGNHDYASNHADWMGVTLNRLNIRLLRNRAVEFRGVIINGIDDGLYGEDRHDNLSKAHDKNVITVFHEPDFIDRVDKRASIMLAGHSHGGQICMPGGFALHTPFGARKYVAGYYDEGTVPLYVTRGIGMMGPHYRAFCKPEISVLELFSA